MTAKRKPSEVATSAHVLATMVYPEEMPSMEPWRERSGRVSRDEGLGTVVCHFNTDPATAPLRNVLRWTWVNCAELWAIARRLGLPDTSVKTKCPYYRQVSFEFTACSAF